MMLLLHYDVYSSILLVRSVPVGHHEVTPADDVALADIRALENSVALIDDRCWSAWTFWVVLGV